MKLKDLDGAGLRKVVDRVKEGVEAVGAEIAGGVLPPRGDPPIGDALRLIRTRMCLTQTAAASRGPGAPNFRSISKWETRRKLPSLRALYRYLISLGLDLHDLQEAIDQLEGRSVGDMAKITWRVVKVERRLGEVERMIEGAKGALPNR